MPNSLAHLPAFEPALRVLVADDNELNQLVVCRALEDWNVQTALADNGRQAVELACREPFDAILMDIQMPEMDGYEATRHLRRVQHLQQLPIIGLTASASPQDQAQALSAGMNATLAKPFDPALLHACLLQYTHAHKAAAFPVDAPAAGLGLSNEVTCEPSWELLEELAAGNEGFIVQIITTFLQQTPPLYEQLAAADSVAQPRLAHKLKGQVMYFGVPGIQQCLEQLERPPAGTTLAQAQQLIETIGQQLTALYPHLETRLRNAFPRHLP